ncbi:nucleotide exchange factor GrpE [Thermodesulfovibrio hydrogeniphilus]
MEDINKEVEQLKYEGAALEDKPRDVAEELQMELAEMKEKYLRLYAEFENYKKMVQKEREELTNYAHEKIIKDLLPIIDNFELAIKHASGVDSSKYVESMKAGIENTLKEFFRILEKYGVKPIETIGQGFNPEVHHAISTLETDEMDENIVVDELRKGYTYKDKLLREPLVVVSKKPKPSEEGSSHPSGAEN